MSVQSVLDSSSSDSEKWRQIKEIALGSVRARGDRSSSTTTITTASPNTIASQIPVPESVSIDESTPFLAVQLLLLKIELLNDTKSPALESLYQQVQRALPRGLTAFTRDLHTLYVKIKYEDLFSDHQIFGSHPSPSPSPVAEVPAAAPKFMDLVNKKLMLVTNIPDSATEEDEEVLELTAAIYRKIVDSLLVSGFEFQKRNLLLHINEKLGGVFSAAAAPATTQLSTRLATRFNEQLPQATRALVRATIESRLVPWAAFQEYLSRDFYYAHSCSVLGCSTALVENHLENNISTLGKYYDNISLERVRSLLIGGGGGAELKSIDVEALIAGMIAADKLAAGTQIDQLDGVVYFPEQEDYSKMGDICEMIDQITNLIEIA